MKTIQMSGLKLTGRDAIGLYVEALDHEGQWVGVSRAGRDEVLRSLDDIEPGGLLEAGTDCLEVQ